MKKPFKIGLFLVATLLLTSCAFAQTGYITTVAGTSLTTTPYSGDGGQATASTLNYPEYCVFDASGNLYISDANNNVIRKVTTAGVISTFAGLSYTVTSLFGAPVPNGGLSGDGGKATNAKLHAPYQLAIDKNNNMYIADVANNRIRVINTAGVISVFAGGNGGYSTVYGYSGDGGQAVNSRLFNPQGVAVDTNLNVYIADTRNQVIRKVATTGVITTIAGTGNTAGYTGDGGAAISATLNYPTGILIGKAQNLYIADKMNNVIRKVILSTGIISTYAGTGTLGYSGDAGAATAATLDYPATLGQDSVGNIYIADQGNQVIRKVTTAGTISTYAGNGTGKGTLVGGYSGDGGAATSATLNLPSGVAFRFGHGYISDSKNNVIRKVN